VTKSLEEHADDLLGMPIDAINAIPSGCEAPAGWVTHFDLGLARPRGLVRK
jgi:hypothetical protein